MGKSHLRPKIQKLEQELKDKLIRTGLVTSINIHSGDLNDPQNPLYLEYKLKPNKNPKKTKRKFEFLRNTLIKRIMQNNPQIAEIKKEYDINTEIYRDIIVINPITKIDDEVSFKYHIFLTLIKEINNYQIRNDKNIQGRSFQRSF